jgi:hypothetical protein
MGIVLDSVGRMTIEVRRDSFKIHPDYDDLASHPEFLLVDLDSLIEALTNAREYLRKSRTETPAARWPQYVLDAAAKEGKTPEELEAEFQAWQALRHESRD